MQLHKTDRARDELKAGVRTLGQRERTLLLLADGNKSAQDFRALFGGDGEIIARRLLEDGYLQLLEKTRTAAAQPGQAQSPGAAVRPPASGQATEIRVSADAFDGKRSLATTRMFLFDLCERMFRRHNPGLAERIHQALREAKDRESMLAVSRELIEEIETAAGHERADSISERLAMLLPAEAMAS